MVFCGVFDGHGPWGHFVAKTIRELFPSFLLCNWQEAVALNAHNLDYSFGPDRNQIQFDIWKQSYCKTCAAVDQELQQNSGIDSFYSGSTALALVRQVMQFLLRIQSSSRNMYQCVFSLLWGLSHLSVRC